MADDEHRAAQYARTMRQGPFLRGDVPVNAPVASGQWRFAPDASGGWWHRRALVGLALWLRHRRSSFGTPEARRMERLGRRVRRQRARDRRKGGR